MPTLINKLRHTLSPRDVSIVEVEHNVYTLTFSNGDYALKPFIALTVAIKDSHLYVRRLTVIDESAFTFNQKIRRAHWAISKLAHACYLIGSQRNTEVTMLVNNAICPFSRMNSFLERRTEYNPILNKYGVYRTYRYISIYTALKRAVLRKLTLDFKVLPLNKVGVSNAQAIRR